MKQPDKPCPDKEPSSVNPTRLQEVLRVIEDYAEDLREIIRKLRRKMN
jgi:hypothetical protein